MTIKPKNLVDWVPTFPEIFAWIVCRIIGHDWEDTIDYCDRCDKDWT